MNTLSRRGIHSASAAALAWAHFPRAALARAGSPLALPAATRRLDVDGRAATGFGPTGRGGHGSGTGTPPMGGMALQGMMGAVRGTVHVPPMPMADVAPDAGEAARGMLHCQQIPHLASGMMPGFAVTASV